MLPLPVTDVAIHATKRIERKLLEEPLVQALVRRLEPIVFASGAVIGVVDIVDHWETEDLCPSDGICEIDELEWTLGNYEPGRFAFQFGNVRPLREPVALKGKQGVLWTAPPELEARIREQL